MKEPHDLKELHGVRDLHRWMRHHKLVFTDAHGIILKPYKNWDRDRRWILSWPEDWVVGTVWVPVNGLRMDLRHIRYANLSDARKGMASIYGKE